MMLAKTACQVFMGLTLVEDAPVDPDPLLVCDHHLDVVRGHLCSLIPPTEYVYLDIPDTLCLSNSPYIPPHRRQIPFPSDNFVCASVCPNSET